MRKKTIIIRSLPPLEHLLLAQEQPEQRPVQPKDTVIKVPVNNYWIPLIKSQLEALRRRKQQQNRRRAYEELFTL